LSIFEKPTPNWGRGVPARLHLFRNFLRLVWRHLGLPEPTPVQLDIADWLQFGPRRLVTEAFRGVGKSYITSAFTCWCLLMDPDVAILVVSASKIRADDFTTFTLRLITEMEILQHLVPTANQRNSKVAFDVAPAAAKHSPSVKSVGITGQLAGSRAWLIVADDIEVPNNSGTQMMREKLAEQIKEFDAVLVPNGRVIYLGTPQTEQSIYNLLPARGYQIRIWPALFPSPEQLKNYGDRLAPFVAKQLAANDRLVGHSVDPKRFTDEDLVERELSYGRSGFALQFMLDTRLSDADRYPLKISDLIVGDVDLDLAPERVVWASGRETAIDTLPNVAFNGDRFHRAMDFERDAHGNVRRRAVDARVMAIDPSGRGKDETTYTVGGLLNGFIHVPEWGGFLDGYSDDTMIALCNVAKKFKVQRVLVEPNFGDGMFNKLLEYHMNRIYPCRVEDADRSTTQKERRIIDTLEPVMNQHRLILSAAAIKRDYESVQHLPPEEALSYMLIYQLTRLTKDRGALKRDDRLDSLAILVRHFTELMSIDANEAVKEHAQRLLDEELHRFQNHVFGFGSVQENPLGLMHYSQPTLQGHRRNG
jgi:hypothetical protein